MGLSDLDISGTDCFMLAIIANAAKTKPPAANDDEMSSFKISVNALTSNSKQYPIFLENKNFIPTTVKLRITSEITGLSM